MKPLDYLALAWAAMRANPIRTFLTMLGIIIGVGSMVSMAAIGAGAQAQVQEQIRSFGANVLMINPSVRNQGGIRKAGNFRRQLTIDDAQEIAKLSSIRAAAPSVAGSAQVVYGGMNWATLQNTPFQYFKHFTEEGGIATPLIAYWPRGIDPKVRGTLNAAPGHLIDIMPTLVDVAGATYPKSYKGHAIIPMQGRSMMPAFEGRPLVRDKPIFWEHEGNRAVRDGKWKLVARFQQPWQLFDMTADRTEMHDLAASQPARVKKMADEWDEWAAASDVDPWQDQYDRNLKGRARQNWGGAGIPARPYALRR